MAEAMLGNGERQRVSHEGSRPSPVYVLDEDGRFTYVNEAAEEIFQTPRGELEGETFWAQIPEEMEEGYREPFMRALEEGEPTEFEIRCPLTGRWYEFRAYPFEDQISVRAHDIEDRARRKSAYELRERSLRAIYELIADPDRSLTEQVDGILTVLRRALDTELGALSAVDLDGGAYSVMSLDADPPVPTLGDESLPLGEVAGCSAVVRTEQTLAAPDLRPGSGQRHERALPSAAYLGTPVRVGEEVSGTLRFSSSEPRTEAFATWQISYVEMFADWIGKELERQDEVPLGRA